MNEELQIAFGKAWKKMARAEGHRKGVPCLVSKGTRVASHVLPDRILAHLREDGPKTLIDIRKNFYSGGRLTAVVKELQAAGKIRVVVLPPSKNNISSKMIEAID